MNTRLLLRLALLLVICGYAGSFAFADNIIPCLTSDRFWLMGSEGWGGGDLGFFLNQCGGAGTVLFNASMSNVKYTKTCFDDQCLYGWNEWTGPVNSGTITMHLDSDFGSYDFSGMILPPGWFDRWEDFSPNCYDICEDEDISISFKGMWTSGWVSTGNLDVGYPNFHPAIGSMSITTFATPEPCTLALLATAGLWGAMRRRHRTSG